MKQLLTLIIFAAAFMSNSIAQEKTIYVIDGYTLEPLVGFTATANSPKLTIKTDYNTLVTDAKSKGNVTVSKENYITTTFELTGSKTHYIALQPTSDQILALRTKYIPSAVPESNINYDSLAEIIESRSDKSRSKEQSDKTPIALYADLDVKAEFPGGMNELYQFLGKNMEYPQDEIKYDIGGKIYCKFVVRKDGAITDIKIIKGATKNLEMEAIRVLSLMPKWKPAQQDGKSVDSYYTLPIIFKLQ